MTQKTFTAYEVFSIFRVQDHLTLLFNKKNVMSLDLTLKQFVCAVQSSVKQTSIFPKREPNAVRINNYNPFVLYLWRGNMDIQYVTSVYGAAKYIASYTSKPNKGASELMRNSNEQSSKQPDNRSLQDLRKLSSDFSRALELTAQEACVLLLRLRLVYCSRTVVFINTSPIGERTVLLKPLNEIEQLPDDSTDIAMSNFQSRYPSRPALLKNVCLAEWFSRYAIRYNSAKKERRSNEDSLAHGFYGFRFRYRS